MNRRTSFLLLGIVFLLTVTVVAFYWTDSFSPSTTLNLLDEDPATKSDGSSGTPFENIVELGTGSLPLRSQHAVAEWDGSPLTVFTDEGSIYVADIHGVRYQVVSLEKGAQGPTLATHDGRAVVAWVTPEAIVSSSSTDLLEWSEPIVVGVRKEKGGPIPSIDWTGSEFAVVWVDAPKTNEATGAMDGVGTLQVAIGDGVNDWSVESINQTAAVVSIAGPTIVWRDDRSETGSRFDTVRMMNIYEGEETVVVSGYDPAVDVDGDDIAIGYHVGAAAHLRTSQDGGVTWEDIVLDTSGKFVAPLVSDGVFGAVWVDYTNNEAAMDARNNSGHRTTALWGDQQYFMNEGASYTVQGQGSVIDGIPVSVYQVEGVIFLAH